MGGGGKGAVRFFLGNKMGDESEGARGAVRSCLAVSALTQLLSDCLR